MFSFFTRNTSDDDRLKGRSEGQAMMAGLPREIVIQICQFMTLDDLFNFAQCNVTLFKTLFNQTPKRTNEIIALKTPTWLMKMRNKQAPSIVSEELIAEYGKDDLENTSDEFMHIQVTLWKPLVCFYFPKFQQSLNIRRGEFNI